MAIALKQIVWEGYAHKQQTPINPLIFLWVTVYYYPVIKFISGFRPISIPWIPQAFQERELPKHPERVCDSFSK
ncbi:hypothetical protein [Nostoc sp. UHCC 0251]|uniref:hypothetical protein n=1 Tax=Nostoc sp. UHCC 0251 TaxID=3110240 RepID=UPI002B1F6780|nr:hypothetical protein [Nostoc sp. UHCC 0251]MEA5621879.1 hypothetical protein [Nostoc sp. UHCC 0251]